MAEKYVIAIARGYGSGGKYIGTKLAERLGIRLIDRELLEMASVESGISEELFSMADEKVRKRFFEFKDDKKYNYGLISPEREGFVSDQNLFNWQARILLKLALEESYIVIGRAADYVLQHNKNVLSVNIQAPFEDCVESIMNRKFVSAKEAIRDIKNTDKYRAEYYKAYTGQTWNDPVNYDICLNSSKIGREKCVDVIIQAAETKFGFEL